MAGASSVKKDRDPIMMVCFIIFAVAAVIAVGAFISNEYFPSGDESASMGDKVSVEYTGTFYGAYGTDYAVVFDTNVASIGNDSNVKKSNDYTTKTTYSDLSFTVGNGTMLKVFEESVIGHKVGDKYNIVLTPEQGYVAADTTFHMSKTGNTTQASYTMTKTKFASIYSDVTLQENQNVEFTSKMGWKANAMLFDNGKMVQVTCLADVGETYKVYESGSTVVNIKVTAINGNDLTYNFEITNPVTVDSSGDIQMIKLELDETFYITAINGSDITCKYGSEKTNETLYFEIKILKIE